MAAVKNMSLFDNQMVTWFSQVGQDKVVHSLSGPGIFVDLAANDPYENSNTASLERLGWRGICIDPTLRSKQLFRNSNRSCEFVNSLVGFRDESTIFREITPVRQNRHSWMFGLSGVVSHESSDTCWGKGYCISVHQLKTRGLRVDHRIMNAESLDTILNRHGINSIDYLSLDVEGFEFDVLSGCSRTPKLLSIEKPDGRCRRILQKNMRFLRHLGTFGEEFWIKKSGVRVETA